MEEAQRARLSQAAAEAHFQARTYDKFAAAELARTNWHALGAVQSGAALKLGVAGWAKSRQVR